MTKNNISKDNHYISQGYLKHWGYCANEVFVYRKLVSHENVPIWEKRAIKGIAYQQHLYTRKVAGKVSDELEKWFDQEFESPAEEVIQKVIANQRLTPEDWKKLIRFFALHDVRTPARYIEHIERFSKSMPEILEEVLDGLPEKLHKTKKATTSSPEAFSFPLRLTTEANEGEELSTLKVETAAGRASWLWSVRHVLERTANVLHNHKWTILRPSPGMCWFTSDKPAVRLNYYKQENYDFGGGWGNKGTELFLPVSPNHLLYTKVGERVPPRGTRLSAKETHMFRRLIAEHSHRMIFANIEDPEVLEFIPRIIDAKGFRMEKQQWENWHEEQNQLEAHLLVKLQKNL